MTESSWGENPPLPPELIRALRERTKLRDRAWDTAANAAVVLFEGWMKR